MTMPPFALVCAFSAFFFVLLVLIHDETLCHTTLLFFVVIIIFIIAAIHTNDVARLLHEILPFFITMRGHSLIGRRALACLFGHGRRRRSRLDATRRAVASDRMDRQGIIT